VGKSNSEAAARAIMIAAGFQPSVPYTSALSPWPGVCLKCGQPGSPRYNDVQQGKGGCAYCARRRTDSAVAVGKMLARDFQPSVPYLGNKAPWPGVCLKCGQPGSPRYNDVQQGDGACGYCARQHVDSAVAVGKMLARDFQPSVPFPGVEHPWPGVCLKCGQPGSPRYSDVRSGQGACASCSDHGYNIGKPGTFYIVASADWLKVGITNSPKSRLSTHRSQGLTDVLHLIEFSSGQAALDLEKTWKQWVASLPSHLRATRANIKDGHTETVRNLPHVHSWIAENLGLVA